VSNFGFWALRLLGIVLLVGSLVYLTPLWVYLVLSLIVAFIGAPLHQWLLGKALFKHHWGNDLAALSVLFVFVLVLAGLVALIVPMLTHQMAILGQIDPNKVLLSLETEFYRLADRAKAAGWWPSAEQWQKISDEALGWLSMNELGNYFSGIIGFTVDLLVAAFSIGFMSYYFLRDRGLAGRVVRAFTPDERLPAMQQAMHQSRLLLTRYFVGLLIQMSIVAVLVATGLWLLGVDYALTLGILAGIFNLIPYVGPYLGGSLGLFIALTAELNTGSEIDLIGYAAKVLGVFVVVQLTDNLLLQPIIFSKSVQAHPLEIFLVVLVAGSLFGLAGMLAAIPVYTIARVVARHFWADKKWVRELTKGME